MSNAWTVALAMKTRLAAAVWPGVGGEVVFANVLISAGIDIERIRSQSRWPICLILPQDLTLDDESEDLVSQRYTILIAQRVAADPWGETVLIGGPGPSGDLTSLGRGLMELEAVLFDAMKLLGPTLGTTIQLRSASAIAAELDADHGYVAQRQYTWEAWTGAGDTTAVPS